MIVDTNQTRTLSFATSLHEELVRSMSDIHIKPTPSTSTTDVNGKKDGSTVPVNRSCGISATMASSITSSTTRWSHEFHDNEYDSSLPQSRSDLRRISADRTKRKAAVVMSLARLLDDMHDTKRKEVQSQRRASLVQQISNTNEQISERTKEVLETRRRGSVERMERRSSQAAMHVEDLRRRLGLRKEEKEQCEGEEDDLCTPLSPSSEHKSKRSLRAWASNPTSTCTSATSSVGPSRRSSWGSTRSRSSTPSASVTSLRRASLKPLSSCGTPTTTSRQDSPAPSPPPHDNNNASVRRGSRADRIAALQLTRHLSNA